MLAQNFQHPWLLESLLPIGVTIGWRQSKKRQQKTIDVAAAGPSNQATNSSEERRRYEWMCLLLWWDCYNLQNRNWASISSMQLV